MENQIIIENNSLKKSINNWPIVILVISNLFPLFGIFFLNWSITPILILYWAENVVIGFYNIFKILKAEAKESGPRITGFQLAIDSFPKLLWPIKIAIAFFFAFHFGIFMIGHGFFLYAFLKMGTLPSFSFSFYEFIFPVILLFISHGISYKQNFIDKQEYKNTSSYDQMNQPYSRMAIMHMVIMALGISFSFLGSPKYALILLIGLKIYIDLKSHLKEHELKTVV